MQRKITAPLTLALWSLAAAGIAAVILALFPAVDAYRELQLLQNATPTPTADTSSMLLVTPDPNNTPAPTLLMLRTGSAGNEVERLQQRLRELGFYDGEADGKFGSGTDAAVRAFQAQHNLDADGVAGENTLALAYGPGAATRTPSTPPPDTLSKGDRGDSVKELQQRLKDLGFYKGAVDGDYGGNTAEAVRLFQQQHGIDPDSVAGPQTLSLLHSSQAKQAADIPAPDPATLPLLVNASHPVTADYRPSALTNLRSALSSSLVNVKGSDIQGDPAAVTALKEMLEAAKEEGVTGFQVSAGYRSIPYQQELFDKQVNSLMAEGKTKNQATSETKLTVALPGASEHHTGLAFDITTAGSLFIDTPQQIWLHKRCWDYGFIIRYQKDKEDITGILAEPWHIRYVGLPHSTAMRDANLCLEEYVTEAAKGRGA